MSINNLLKPADIPQLVNGFPITKLMYIIWSSRVDLKIAFDIFTAQGQKGLLAWYKESVLREYGLNPEVEEYNESLNIQESIIRKYSKYFPNSIRRLGKYFWIKYRAKVAEGLALNYLTRKGVHRAKKINVDVYSGETGANLIGYAYAELGMGEHVRMTAAALVTTAIKFGVMNFDIGVPTQKKAILEYGEPISNNKYNINLFHVNADQILRAYCHYGHDFFYRKYNIGYWAWELAKCPDDWVPMMEMVDEIWAPSRFIQTAFSEKTKKPVIYMPLCVTLPQFQCRSRTYFKVSKDNFLFLFVFDFNSYIERKNPFAAISAFKNAFPDKTKKVGLVIKVMNSNYRDPKWLYMIKLIDDDIRIHVIDQTLNRNDILALIDSCNSFISLHRSEGFGRGPAEAMLLGKPVIVSNYSGNTDFTLSDNSCLVNYKLIPVYSEQYVFEHDQVWADPDIEHASWHMRRLVSDSVLASQIGLRAGAYIRDNFNRKVIGEKYSKRLIEISNFSTPKF